MEKEYQTNLPKVALDEALCEQSFVNIIQNAYDAMSAEGGGVLRVQVNTARRSTRDRDNIDGVEVRIADSGPGNPDRFAGANLQSIRNNEEERSGTGSVHCFQDHRRASWFNPY